jgi:light-regulated signal transduction histidine kinase (bacteriophytochrome)
MLVDAIVLGEDFRIIAASQNILDYVGFSNDELKNQSINFLAGDQDLGSILKSDLAAGYFSDKRARLFTKTKKWISVSLTGFYLGLISDLNGSIILKIKNLDELNLVNHQLLLKKAELEDFIYRTSHDLRGPLATIRGLVNLIRARKDNDELELLINMMSERTDKLNERLSQLLCLTLAGREVSTPNYTVDFKVIECQVKKIANENAVPASVKLNFSAPDVELYGVNEILVQGLIISLLQHALSLPMSQLNSVISIVIAIQKDALNLIIESTGFTVNKTLQDALLGSEFIYSDIMNHPQLVNYYTAQKIVSELKSQIFYDFITENNQRFRVSIPLHSNAKFPAISGSVNLEIFG